MKLYHGTTGKIAKQALKRGLLSRDASGHKGNWQVESNPGLVYLTALYAAYFAFSAAEVGEPWGIVEVETDRLREDRFYPDEDFLEQATRRTQHPSHAPLDADMETRTAFYRERLPLFAHYWRQSVEGLGNCSYSQRIPPGAITRAGIYDPGSNPPVTMCAIDPQITLMNATIMGDKYRALTRWLMGEDVAPHDLAPTLGPGWPEPPEGSRLAESVRRDREEWPKILAKRDGLKVLSGTSPARKVLERNKRRRRAR